LTSPQESLFGRREDAPERLLAFTKPSALRREEIRLVILVTRLAHSIRAKPVYHKQNLLVAVVCGRGCRSQRLRLQVAAFEQNRSGAFHFIERAADVTAFQFNAATAVDDDMRVQSELAGIECAVFHTIVQGQTH
jgi:hypothetical protein